MMKNDVNIELVNQIINLAGFQDYESIIKEVENASNTYSNYIKSIETILDSVKGQTELTVFIGGELFNQLNDIQRDATIIRTSFDKITINLMKALQSELNKIKSGLTADTVNDYYEYFKALKFVWEEIVEKYFIKFMAYTKSFNSVLKRLYKGISGAVFSESHSLNSALYYPTLKILMKDLERKFSEYLNDYDFEGKIRFYIKTTQEGVEVLSENSFDMNELEDDIVHNLDIEVPYRYYGSSKSGIVYIEPLLTDYNELSAIDYDVLIDEVFKKYPSVTMMKLKLNKASMPTLSLDEIMSNTTKYLNKPVKFKAIVSSLLKPSTRLFRAKIHKKDGDEITYFLLPQSTFVDRTGRKVKIVPNDEDNIETTIQRGTLLPLPEDTENFGSQMQTIPFVIEGDLVGKLQIGERYTFYGIPFRDDPSKVESQVVILITNAKPYKKKEVKITKEDIEFFKKLKNENILKLLIDSYAPHIKYTREWDYVWSMKLASLILAVGVPKNINPKYRSTMNILFIGSAGIAKSVIATELQEITDKVLYSSGKGASGVGITASVVKDEITGKRTVQAGVIVLANNGIAIIDEFDKIKPEDRDMLYEALEKMQITVSKYGLYVVLPAKTSVIAVANFDEATQRQISETGEIDLNLAIRRMRISEALFSRFDLVLLAYDVPDEEKDEQIAKHIIDAMFNRLPATPLDYTMLTKYINYVKNINPELPEDIENILIEKYKEYRKNYKKRVFTPRQLISLIRVVLAIARLKQHSIVTDDDLEDAIRLFEVSESIIEEATTVKTIDEDELKEEVYSLLKELKGYPSVSFDSFMKLLFARVAYADEIKPDVTEQVKNLLLTKFRKHIELLGTEMSSLLKNSEVPVFRVKKI